MKSLLFALLLMGCATAPSHNQVLPQTPAPIFTGNLPIIDGTYYLVDWKCQPNFNFKDLVWVNCIFLNNSHRTKDTCIEVSYSKNEQVIAKEKVCSGVLSPSMKTAEYAAFTGIKFRKLEEECGINFSNCVISTKRIKIED